MKRRFLNLDRPESGGRVHEHSIGSETTLAQPLLDAAAMEQVLGGLVGEVAARLRRQGGRARRITLKLRYSDFKTITRSRTLKAPTCFDVDIFKVARELLEANLAPDRPVRLLGSQHRRHLHGGMAGLDLRLPRARFHGTALQGHRPAAAQVWGDETVTLGAGKNREH